MIQTGPVRTCFLALLFQFGRQRRKLLIDVVDHHDLVPEARPVVSVRQLEGVAEEIDERGDVVQPVDDGNTYGRG